MAVGAQTYDGVGPMGDASIHSIRIAGPADFGCGQRTARGKLFALLVARYDRDLLGRALPFMTSANPILLASGTYDVAEREPGHLVGCGGWTAARPGSGEIIEAESTHSSLCDASRVGGAGNWDPPARALLQRRPSTRHPTTALLFDMER